MAFMSLRQVDSLTSAQITNRLKQDAKFFGLSIYDRLLHIEDKLLFYADNLYSGQLNPIIRDSDQAHIAGLLLLSNGNVASVIYGDTQQIPAFAKAELGHMRDGKSVISIIKNPGLAPGIFVSRLVDPTKEEPVIISALIEQSYLWGDPDLFSENMSLCVSSPSSGHLYCSQDSAVPSLNMLKGEREISTASATGILSSENKLSGRWRLFLKARYLQNEWIVRLSQNRTDAFAQLQLFSANYVLVLLLVLMIVTLSSIYLIRKNTRPLEALMHGIRNIANNRFDTEVSVDSSDEFGEVAVAFNSMSSRIGNQIERLKTQAEIDQLILSRPSVDDIVNIALDGIERMVPCDWLGLATMDEKKSRVFQLKGRVNGEDKTSSIKSFKLSRKGLQEVFTGSSVLDTNRNIQFATLLQNTSKTVCRFWLIAPIAAMDEPVAILILGYESNPAAEDIYYTNEFSSRIAVAFSNAAWEEKLYKQAHFDHLTELPNRLLMHDRLQQELNHVARTKGYFAVLFLDLDRFKNVNDSLGHEYGDTLLSIIARRLLKCMRQDDTVARLGGDEFIILIRSLESSEKALATASLVAEKIISEVSKPVLLEQHDIRMTTSIGIVVCPTDGQNVDTLLRNADSAMYHAKDQGGGNFEFYSEHLNETAKYRLQMESRLRKALDEQEFEFHYQPKVDPITGAITSAEALLRWMDKTEGIIYPDKYIHVAEEIGLITPIGMWGLKVACLQAKEWTKLRSDPFRVSVNISAQHFHHGDLVEHVSAALHESGLDPSSLELEITESTAMSSMDRTVAIMNNLRDMGVAISIDDFGTGHSSLTYLKNFPVYALKIDRSFISQITQSEKDMAIVKSTISLAHNLGLKVIAEGVETNEQFQALFSMDCDELQGYFFSWPVPAAQFSEMLASGKLDLSENSGAAKEQG